MTTRLYRKTLRVDGPLALIGDYVEGYHVSFKVPKCIPFKAGEPKPILEMGVNREGEVICNLLFTTVDASKERT